MDNSIERTTRVYGMAEPADSRYKELDIKQLIGTLIRRKWLIVAIITIGSAVSALISFSATPLYTANLQLLFDSKEQSVMNFDALISGELQDEATLLSTIEVLKSRSLAGRLIDKLGLLNDPEFNRERAAPGLFAKLLGRSNAIPVSSDDNRSSASPPAPSGRGAEPPRGEVSQEDAVAVAVGISQGNITTWQRERVVDAVIERIDVMQSGRSRAVDVNFTCTDPGKAAIIANTLGDLILTDRLEGKLENARRATKWVAEQVQKLREQVEGSENELENYRKQHDLLQGERTTLITERISSLNLQFSEIQRMRMEAEANFAQAQRLLESPDKLNTAAQVLESPLIQNLLEAQSTLSRREAALAEELGPAHPEIIQLRREQSKQLADIQGEVRKIISSLKNKTDIAREQEAFVVEELNTLKAKVGEANEAGVGLRRIEREAEANRLILEKFLSAFMEVSAQGTLSSHLPDARIISAAVVPEEPSFPNKLLIVSGGFVFSALVALLLALSLERLDAGFRSAEQLEQETGLSVVAHVPIIAASKIRDPANYILEWPASAFGESIRSLSTRLLLAPPGSPPQVVLVTSAEPEEGKTSISLSLARMQAMSGRKVVLVDADFRRSTIGDALELQVLPGLLEVMNGAASIEEATRKDEATGLDIVVTGAPYTVALYAVSADAMDGILRNLRSRYDLIIIDCAPIFATTDAQLLAAVADETLLVVRWGVTRREVVGFAVRQLKTTARHLGGAILSRIDVAKLAGYNYGDSRYFLKAKRYYAT